MFFHVLQINAGVFNRASFFAAGDLNGDARRRIGLSGVGFRIRVRNALRTGQRASREESENPDPCRPSMRKFHLETQSILYVLRIQIKCHSTVPRQAIAADSFFGRAVSGTRPGPEILTPADGLAHVAPVTSLESARQAT